VGGRDEVDVMAALALQREHHVGESRRGDLPAHVLLADIVVLAEDAGQIAAGKEDGARAVATNEGRLFAEVRGKAGHSGPSPGTAEAAFIPQAVHAAAPGADLAGRQAGHSSMGAILQNFTGHLVVTGQENPS